MWNIRCCVRKLYINTYWNSKSFKLKYLSNQYKKWKRTRWAEINKKMKIRVEDNWLEKIKSNKLEEILGKT